MNNMQHGQLFTDLAPAQAETIAAGSTPVDASANYGYVNSDVTRVGKNMLNVNVYVKDTLKNSYPVYARLQGLATDGDILITSKKLWDTKGADGAGSQYNFRFGFNKFNKNIKQLRAVIYQDDPGSDTATPGEWVTV